MDSRGLSVIDDTDIALSALVLGQLFQFVFFESVNVLLNNITSDVLCKIIKNLIINFLYAIFKVRSD